MRRRLEGGWAWATRLIAILYTIFQLYTAGLGLLPDMQQRAVHVGFGLVLTLMLFSPVRQSRPGKSVPVWDVVLILLVVASAVNTFVKYEWFLVNIGETSDLDLFLGAAIVVIAIDSARRVMGWVFPIFTILMVLYTLFGRFVPGVFGHRGFSLGFMIQMLNQTTQGVWGYVTGISATLLAVFLIFGAFLLFTGGGETFMLLAIKVAGRLRGGPALVSVVASALFGMISGSAVANIMTVGNFTIPLMKRLGYRSEFAGGVEATASTGGQIMPPIMGAGAFIMAEMLGVPYIKVAAYAAVPAVLYYLTVFLSVRFEALRVGLPAVPPEQIPEWREVLTWQRLAPLFLPIFVLLGLLMTGWSITMSGFWACVSTLVLYLFSNFSLSDMKTRWRKIVEGSEKAAYSIVEIVSLVVCANIVIALIGLTGLGVKLSEMIVGAAGSSLLLALVLTALVALVLGMGVPTTAAYILTAAVCGPALVTLGLNPIASQLFIFYYAIIAVLTPPVCIAVYCGAALAQAAWLKVAWVALRLAAVGFLVPFFFVYEPALILQGPPASIVVAVATAGAGSVFVAAGAMGYLTFRLGIPARILLFAGGFGLVYPSLLTGAVGALLIAAGVAGQWYRNRAVTARLRRP